MNYRLKAPFEIYLNGTEIADREGHMCTAESPEIAQAIMTALMSLEEIQRLCHEPHLSRDAILRVANAAVERRSPQDPERAK